MREGLGVFQTISDQLFESSDTVQHAKDSQLLLAMLTWTMYLGARSPIKALVWSAVLSAVAELLDWLVGFEVFQSYVIAQTMAAIASIIFGYMGCVMEYATDTVFYCMAVEAEAGERDARTVKLQDPLQKQVQDEANAAAL